MRKRKKTYGTGQLGWNRESHLHANIAAAALVASTLAVLVLAVYWR